MEKFGISDIGRIEQSEESNAKFRLAPYSFPVFVGFRIGTPD